ncbi:MAG: phosphotransferase, partial [Bacteroidetes bacterium]|nr:phosphotransferase [Bacteroidota bacterium]
DYEILWDVRQVEKLEPFLGHVDDPFLRNFISNQMSIFKETIKPSLEEMTSQVIFNDMSPRNYIVAPEDPSILKGFIDFGDMINAPRIIDITIACIYWINDLDDRFSSVVQFLQGYNDHHHLNIDELAILQDLMLCRCMTQVLIYHWRASMFPENKEYIMQNLPQARKTIEKLSAIDKAETLNKLANACELNNI